MAIFHKATFTLYSENLRSQIRVHVISSLQDSIICLSLPRPPCLASARTPTWAVGFRPFRPNWKALLLTENASAQAWKAEMLQPRSQRSGGLGIRQQTIESWKDDIVFLRHDRKGEHGLCKGLDHLCSENFLLQIDSVSHRNCDRKFSLQRWSRPFFWYRVCIFVWFKCRSH